MNVTERLALSQGPLVYEEMTSAVDDRTLEILDRRRKTATIRRRGWLIRRMLLLADVVGLTVAYVLAEILFGDATASGPRGELLAFLVTLPVWVVVAKLYGLYDRDEEGTDHSTIDDFVGVFSPRHDRRMAPLCRSMGDGSCRPALRKAGRLLGLRDHVRPCVQTHGACVLPPEPHVPAEHCHRRRRRCRSARRAQAAPTPGVRHQSCRAVDAEPKERRDDIGRSHSLAQSSGSLRSSVSSTSSA